MFLVSCEIILTKTKAVALEGVDDPVARRIVAAAREHFLGHGFRAVTMDDLAAEMGMSKKTLYVHFHNKRELLEAVIAAKTGDFGKDMDAVKAERREEFADTLQRLLECMAKHAGEISPSFLRDLAKEDAALIAMIKCRRREVIGRTFGRILTVGQKAKAIRKDLSADFMVEVLLGIADTVATPESVSEKGIRPAELLANILKIFLGGIQTK